MTSGDGHDALAQRRASVAHHRAAGDDAGLAYELRHLAMAALDAGLIEEAEAAAVEAVAIYRRRGDAPLDLANALRLVALSGEEGRGMGGGEAAWREARTLYAALGVDAGVEECDGHL